MLLHLILTIGNRTLKYIINQTLEKAFTMATNKITDANFSTDVLQSDKPVVLDFWAEWCGPCLQIAPSLEQISEEMPGVTIAKINIDENPMTPSQFGVRGIPTMVMFKNGEAIATKVGALPKNAIVEWINSSLK